jgi:iron-sulfur cluster repair protein YtfE (RIC family)
MPVATNEFRDAHMRLGARAELLIEAARVLRTVPADERKALRDDVVSFLREEVVPHTQLDERVLYPEVADRLGDPLATASMNYDHIAIRQWTDDIAEAGVDDPHRLERLLYGLYALIRVHMWKEEQLYLAMLEGSSWPAE